MAKDSSFDIVSEPNWSEVLNAVDQTRREVAQRYDFRGHDITVDWDATAKVVQLEAPEGMVMDALSTVLGEKMAKRGVALGYLDFADVTVSGIDRAKRQVRLRHGLESAVAKNIQKAIKGLTAKVDTQIQGDTIRVSAKSKDDLQAVIAWMKTQDFGVELSPTNYR
jgi:uncharacterized protein YajQ (UPF0234 family)